MDQRARPFWLTRFGITTALLAAISGDPSAARAQVVAAPAGEALVDSQRIPVGQSPVQGPRDALVTIVEFGNPVDVYTARLQPVLAAIRARYPNDVRVVWKTHPRTLSLSGGDRLADGLMAAHAQSRFWEFLTRVGAQNAMPSVDDLVRHATAAGLDAPRFRRDLDAHTQRPAVEADGRLAQALGGPDIAPVVYVNGTRVVGYHPIDHYVPLIDAVLAAARAITPRQQVYAQMTAAPIADPLGVPPPAAGQSRVINFNAVYAVPIADAPAIGPADALVTLVAFEDFQCPACARVEPILAELRRRYPQDLRVVWRNLPLWVHLDAIPAAEAALEVFTQAGNTGFWRFHDALFANAGHAGWLDAPVLERTAAAAGADVTRYRTAMAAHRHAARVRDDATMAARFGITGTPGIFVNGRMAAGVQPIERYVAMIERALGEARALVQQGVARGDVYQRVTAPAEARVSYFPAAPDAQPGQPAEPRYTVMPDQRAPSRGRANAPVMIEHFAELESMSTARVAATLDQLMITYGSRVRLVWRDYPTTTHVNAQLAAEAAREIFAQQGSSGFWRFHDTLLANQGALARSDLEGYASAQHVNMPRFRAALDAHTHTAAIRADQAAADAIGVRIDSPATFVNGRLVPVTAPIAEWTRIIDAAIADASQRTPAVPPARARRAR